MNERAYMPDGDPLGDLRKARFYLDREIARREFDAKVERWTTREDR